MLLFPALAIGQTDDRVKRLEEGEVIITSKKVKGAPISGIQCSPSGVPLIKAVGLIKAPPEKVWAIIEKCADYTKTMPRTLKSEELERKGNKIKCRVTIDMPFPLKDITATTDVTHTVTPGKRWKREWKGVGGDLKVNKGSWTLKPYQGGKHTVATYRVLSEPKIEMPQSIQSLARKKTIPKLFEKLRGQVE